MHDLTVVGLSEDGQRLVLASASGEEYAVVVDERLRTALRPFPTRPPAAPVAPGRDPRPARRLETTMDSALRPRDIQARIRAGESPETVAEAAGTTVDGIMAFAGPVLAERAHVAQLAQKASVRRRGGEPGGARVLGEAAEQFLADRHLHEDDVEWDAWRRPDGRWALVATYAVEGRPARAEFTHDLPGRYVVAENDDARTLTGELSAPGAAPEAPTASRRLSSVRFGDEVPLGDDAIELVRDPRPEQPEPTRDEAAPETGPAQPDEVAPPAPSAVDAPAEAPVPTGAGDPVDMDPLPFDPGADTADADWLVAADAPAARPGPAAPEEVPAGGIAARTDAGTPTEDAVEAAEPTSEPVTRARRRACRGPGRRARRRPGPGHAARHRDPTRQAGGRQAPLALVGAVVGRDHVRRRLGQGRLTDPAHGLPALAQAFGSRCGRSHDLDPRHRRLLAGSIAQHVTSSPWDGSMADTTSRP